MKVLIYDAEIPRLDAVADRAGLPLVSSKGRVLPSKPEDARRAQVVRQALEVGLRLAETDPGLLELAASLLEARRSENPSRIAAADSALAGAVLAAAVAGAGG